MDLAQVEFFMPRSNRISVPHLSSQPSVCLALLLAFAPTVCLGAQSGGSIFRNVDASVAYAGSKSCGASGCHEEINRNYAPTPHGQSMALANSPKELARAPQPVTVVDAKNNRYYTVYQDGANLYQSAYELDEKGRKTYSIAHKIDYVTGGESVGYTYLYRIGAWIFQAPLSYYAHSKTWELSPGYAADDVGFNRVMTTAACSATTASPTLCLIATECIRTPHSASASWVSVARAVTVPARST